MPVCVTVTEYIDRLIELGKEPQNVVVTFGDMLRVPGSRCSLSEAKAGGCRVKMVYSPMDILRLAEEDREHIYIFAAVGFETTAPVYAMLLKKALEKGIKNIRLLTSLKVMPPVISWMCAGSADCGIDGFLAPGHVCVITAARPLRGWRHNLESPSWWQALKENRSLLPLRRWLSFRGRAGWQIFILRP